MKIKRILASSLSAVMVLSLVGCTSPKDFFSNLINGNGGNQGGQNIVAASEKVNKNAVFKETTSFDLENFDYADSMICVNGKYYVGQVVYDYPEEDFTGGEDEEVIPFNEGEDEIEYIGELPGTGDEMPVEGPISEDGPVNADLVESEGPNIPVEDGEEGAGNPEDAEVAYDSPESDESIPGDYEDVEVYESNAKVYFRVASFTNASDIKYTDLEMEPEEYVQSNAWGIDEEGNFYVCTNKWSMDGNESTYKIKKFSPDGSLLKNCDIKSTGDYFYINDMLTDEKGNSYVVSEGAVNIYDKDLNPGGSYSADSKDSYINNLMVNSEGEVIFLVESWNNENYSCKAIVMDSTGKTKEDSHLADMLANKYVVSGQGYDYYYKTGSSVMGFNQNDTEATEVLNFFDSDINPDQGYSMCFASPEQFVMVDTEQGVKVCVYDKVPEDQVKDKEIITLGTVYGAYGINSQILDFNKNNDEYRIKIVDYSEYSSADDWDAGRKRFFTDLTGGNAPDIIVPEASDVKNLIDKGVFADLTPIMEKSEGLKKSDLTTNAQTVFAKGDKLYCVFPSFSVEALEIKKSNYKSDMTFDDILEWEKKTGKQAFSDDFTKSSMLSTFMSLGMDAFLDPETGKCSFDSPEFIKILEYSNNYPLEYDDSKYEYYDENTYMNEFRGDNSLFSTAYIYDISQFNWNSAYRFGEETVLTGLPIEGSDGASLQIDSVIGISDKSKHKEAAWEFIKTCFSDEYYDKQGWGLPTVESKLDAKFKEATEPPYYIDEDGNKQEYNQTYWFNDEEVEIQPLTTQKAAEIKEFVVNVTNIYTWDEELSNIVDEETQGYFQGQKSAAEVAGIIQSRLQIYINEKK